MEAIACKACLSDDTEIFYHQADVPTNSCILLETVEEATSYPRGDITLTFCHGCGFIFNQSFDPKLTEYSGRYEETQSFSGTFNKFHIALADRLIAEHDLQNKRVLEIGCGKGEFLQLLCERANTSGIGFDPGYQEGRLDLSEDLDISFVQDFYSEKYIDQSADFVCCKMTLEHIPEVKSFMDVVRNTIAEDEADVFFQIPESERILDSMAFEDVYYEHCNYFTPLSLDSLFRRTRFAVDDVAVEYDDQYLTIEATTKTLPPDSETDQNKVAELWKLARSYSERLGAVVAQWRETIDRCTADGKPVVMWGSGSKGVSFLSAVDRDDSISAVVDINPNRRNHFMCGTGHPIVAPDDLVAIEPGLVIVMNRIYVDEIRDTLAELGLTPEVVALGAQ
ncbi:MAG: methyltransferase domain-containing protein [Acidimicrobiales bacterium]